MQFLFFYLNVLDFSPFYIREKDNKNKKLFLVIE